jgi:hypothetical protein
MDFGIRYPIILLFLFTVVVLSALIPRAFSEITTSRDTLPVTAGADSIPEGWFKGNTHTHSNRSDGDSPPEEVAARYRDLGYDFLVLTDHNIVVDFSQYSEPGFLCIDGEEISDPSNHTNGLGLTSTIVPGTIRENVESVLAQGGVPHLNHPTLNGLGSSDALSAQNLDHMEIYSYRINNNEEHIWDGVLTGGKRLYGLVSDDCHELYSESGKAWIMVRADSLVQDKILNAIADGDFYASTGVILNDYRADTLGMTIDSRNGDRIEFIGQNGRILQTVNDSYGEYLFDDMEPYVRARIRNAAGQFAWTQPVFRPVFEIEPYADEVVDHSGVIAGFPENTLGPPYDGKVASNWREHGVGIEAGGYLVLDMGEGEEIIDREGADLYVEEIGPEDGVGTDDFYRVYVSEDNVDWLYLGEGLGDTYFDLSGILDRARYLMIEVEEKRAEIDGVAANFFDPYADRVIDYSGLIQGYPRYVLGPPTLGPIGDSWEDYAVQIDWGGYLILDLGPDEEVVNAGGPDLYIEEVDVEDGSNYTDASFVLHGSMDGVNWTEIGQGEGDSYFNLPIQLPWARYLKLEPVDTEIEIDGIRVENSAVTSPVGITLVPDIDPIVIPPIGGSFGYSVILENVSRETQYVYAWTMALLPTGRNYGPVLGPIPLTLAEGDILSVNLSQTVPGTAPPGEYLFAAYIGSYPLPVLDVDGFDFIKE